MAKVKQPADRLFLTHIASMASEMRRCGRDGTARNYTSTLRSFRRFLCEWKGSSNNSESRCGDIPVESVTGEMLLAYESWLRTRGVSTNTSSFYMRVLRAAYNQAVGDGADAGHSAPFRRVYTGVGRTRKRAIPLDYVRSMKSLDIADRPRLDFARDVFMLSFYLRGMSFIDLCYLKKSDLHDGVVTYRRRKTGQKLSIGWTSEMQALAMKYSSVPSPYLMPIIPPHTENPATACRNAVRRINRALKVIAAMIGVPSGLTTYVARHSWASAAQSKGIPTVLISEGMGHESETTTRIYLASLETPAALDRANALILRSLK